MSLWKQKIKSVLKGFRRLVIMCIGNSMASDDGAGLEIGNKLLKTLDGCKNILVINCYGSPENFTSVVKKAMPTHILIVDSCISGKKPGTISVFSADELKESDVSSHRIPINLLSRYLENETGASIIIVGIEPESINQGNKLSASVKKSVDEIVEFFRGLKNFREI